MTFFKLIRQNKEKYDMPIDLFSSFKFLGIMQKYFIKTTKDAVSCDRVLSGTCLAWYA